MLALVSSSTPMEMGASSFAKYVIFLLGVVLEQPKILSGEIGHGRTRVAQQQTQ
jgi:hypothetical protein